MQYSPVLGAKNQGNLLLVTDIPWGATSETDQKMGPQCAEGWSGKKMFKKHRLTFHVLSAHQSNKGQGLVEFALLIPILALILVGVFELGRAFHVLITLNNAGREAARYGTLHRTDLDGMRAAALQEAQDSGITIANPNVNIALTCPSAGTDAPCARDTQMRVQITHLYTPILSFFFPSGITINSAVEMRIP